MQKHPSHRAHRYGLVVALLGLGFAVLSAAPAMASTPHPAAFKSNVSGTVTPTVPGTFSLTASGLASYLGNIGYAGTVQITNTGSNGVLTDVLTERLTAANGDVLVLHCEQTATPVATGVYHGIDTWTVVGGTGRFAHATGSGTGSTDADLNAGTFSKTASGMIDLG